MGDLATRASTSATAAAFRPLAPHLLARLVLRPAAATTLAFLALAAPPRPRRLVRGGRAAAATFALGVWDQKERAAIAQLLRGERPDARRLA
jgi:hypothetical protein